MKSLDDLIECELVVMPLQSKKKEEVVRLNQRAKKSGCPTFS